MLPMKNLNMIIWLTQLGLSVAMPLVVFVWGAVWLMERFDLGLWVLFCGIGLGFYCAIDGQLSAVFAISYAKMKSAAAGLVTLSGYRKLTPVVICGDYMITESFLRSKFGIRTRRVSFPAAELRRELRHYQPDPEITAYALTTQETLVSMAYPVTGAQALRTASRIGVAVHLIGGIVGLLIMAALSYLGSTQLLTPIHVLLYQLVWMIPGLLVTDWTRTV